MCGRRGFGSVDEENRARARTPRPSGHSIAGGTRLPNRTRRARYARSVGNNADIGGLGDSCATPCTSLVPPGPAISALLVDYATGGWRAPVRPSVVPIPHPCARDGRSSVMGGAFCSLV